jgi:hypothetical protein
MPDPREPEAELPTRPEKASPDDPHEVENPGDPGPTVLVPPAREDPRKDPRIPDAGDVPPGV